MGKDNNNENENKELIKKLNVMFLNSPGLSVLNLNAGLSPCF